MRVAIITAIYDNYDTVKPVLDQGVDVDWIFVTDNQETAYKAKELGWSPVIEPRPHLSPKKAAKLPKILPWLYTDAPASIWIDGSFRIKSPKLIQEVLPLAKPIAQFNHPWRNCVYEEAKECIKLKRKGSLKEQSTSYKNLGHPPDWGLWASGVVVRNHTIEVIKFGFDWLKDIYLYSSQDQVAEPVALRRNGLRPKELPGSHLSNKWLSFEMSARHP